MLPAGLLEVAPETLANATGDLPSEVAVLWFEVATLFVEDEGGLDGAVHVRAVAPIEVGELRAKEFSDRNAHVCAFLREAVLRMGDMSKEFPHGEGVALHDLVNRFVRDRGKMTDEDEITSRTFAHTCAPCREERYLR